MRIAILFGQFSLTFRGDLDLTDPFNDQRGLSGSELGTIRIAECLAEMGHDVELFTVTPGVEQFGKVRCRDLNEVEAHPDVAIVHTDVAIAVNEPDLLRRPKAKLKVWEMWLNDVTFCRAGFDRYVDLVVSPSEAHRQQVLTNPAWRRVETSREHPDGKEQWTPDPEKCVAIELGCDPELYEILPVEFDGGDDDWQPIKWDTSNGAGGHMANEENYWHGAYGKIPGRVVYCSSPDRGLHWLLQEWPAIKRAVPRASLRVFYHVKRWIDDFKTTPYWPPIEPLRKRAQYVEMALERLRGLDVEVVDSVSRNRVISELCQAECLAYPVDTTVWSEGFSCTILEACAARACPVVFDTDAIGDVYRDAALVRKRGDIEGWRNEVIGVLKNDDGIRDMVNDRARRFAEKRTWRIHAQRLMADIERRI